MNGPQISDAPLVKRGPESPSELEAEVIRLREDCRRVLEELERRYDRLRAIPSEIKERVRAVPHELAVFGRRNAAILIGIGALLVGTVVVVELVQHRRQRGLRGVRRRVIAYLK